MSRTEQNRQRDKRAMAGFAAAMFSCVLGLFFCVVKSPSMASKNYDAAAVFALQSGLHDDALAAALEAVRLNPSSAQGWQTLSHMLRTAGQDYKSFEAASIAARLSGEFEPSSTPVYAMPAALKLSLLGSAREGL